MQCQVKNELVLQQDENRNIDKELIEDILGRMILHWNYRNLRELPVELLLSGDHIKEIYLKRNNLTTLPQDIGKLGNLTNLYLMGNMITSIPREIENLHNLNVLDLSQNRLGSIPSSIGNLGKLEQLLLTQNDLTSLPKELGKLKLLKLLELSGNKLTTLPHAVIGGLKALEEFAIDGNPITSLPRDIVSLPNLRYISVCKCKLQYLPSMPFSSLMNSKRYSKSYSPNDVVPYSSCGRPFADFTLLFDSNPDLKYLPYWIVQLLGPDIEIFGCGIQLAGIRTLEDNTVADAINIGDETKTGPNVGRRRPRINFKHRKESHMLYFDEELMKIHNETSKEPPSLLELCLRRVFIESLHQDSPYDVCNEAQEPLLVKYSTFSSHFKDIEDSGQEILYHSCNESAMEIDKPHVQMKRAKASEIGRQAKSTPLLPQNLSIILDTGEFARCFQCLTPIFTEMWLNLFSVSPNQRQQDENLPILEEHFELLNANRDNIIRKLTCVYLCSTKCQSKLRRRCLDIKSQNNIGDGISFSLKCILTHEIKFNTCF